MISIGADMPTKFVEPGAFAEEGIGPHILNAKRN